MSDNGTHFKNEAIKELCEYWGTQQTFSPAHSPWVNRLVEGTNKLLLYVLGRLCAPDLGEDGWKETQWEVLPRNWPTVLDRAVRILNWRILPALKFAPKELLLGQPATNRKAAFAQAAEEASISDADLHIAYAHNRH
jgi:hypothetical protein